jgi:hypothetical protein
MRKFFILAASVATLVVPTAAMAAAPDGQFHRQNGTQSENASAIGELSSAIKQNGQFVSGNTGVYDQTTYPGSRADAVHAALGH